MGLRARSNLLATLSQYHISKILTYSAPTDYTLSLYGHTLRLAGRHFLGDRDGQARCCSGEQACETRGLEPAVRHCDLYSRASTSIKLFYLPALCYREALFRGRISRNSSYLRSHEQQDYVLLHAIVAFVFSLATILEEASKGLNKSRQKQVTLFGSGSIFYSNGYHKSK